MLELLLCNEDSDGVCGSSVIEIMELVMISGLINILLFNIIIVSIVMIICINILKQIINKLMMRIIYK